MNFFILLVFNNEPRELYQPKVVLTKLDAKFKVDAYYSVMPEDTYVFRTHYDNYAICCNLS